MNNFLIKLACSVLRIQFDTAKTKTFGVGLGFIGAGVSAAAVLINQGDGNVLHYFACAAAVLQGIGTITKHDRLMKLSEKLKEIQGKQ